MEAKYVKKCLATTDEIGKKKLQNILSTNWFAMCALGKIGETNCDMERVKTISNNPEYVEKLFNKTTTFPRFGRNRQTGDFESETLQNNLINVQKHWNKVKSLKIVDLFVTIICYYPKDKLAHFQQGYSDCTVDEFVDINAILNELFDKNGNPVNYSSKAFEETQNQILNEVCDYFGMSPETILGTQVAPTSTESDEQE